MNEKSLFIRHRKKILSPGSVASVSDKFELGIFSQKAFHNMLVIERKRVQRSRKPFLLLLIDLRGLRKNLRKKGELKRFYSVMQESSREIDIKGWYEYGRVFGVMYTEVLPDASGTISSKVRTNLTAAFGAATAAVRISSIYFPEKFDTTADRQIIEYLYPELLGTTITLAFSRLIKRAVDIMGSLAGLVLLSPLFLFVAIKIKRTSEGPVFFRQERVGRNGRRFVCYKFRSMYQNNDDSIHRQFIKQLINLPDCNETDPDLQVSCETQVYKIVDDPRITPFGHILRKTSIDELPQLINVLLGDMSLVGPRPAIPYEVGEYDRWHLERVFPAKPGITGLWQVEGRSMTTFENMVRMDIHYITNWSILLDLKILLKTPLSILSTKGAY